MLSYHFVGETILITAMATAATGCLGRVVHAGVQHCGTIRMILLKLIAARLLLRL